MTEASSKIFSSLRWWRLSASLVNIRTSALMAAHPLTVFQAIIKGVTESAGDREAEPLMFFHLKGKRHTFIIQESAVISLEIFFFRKDAEYVKRWIEAFRNYISDPVTGRNYDIVKMGEAEERSFDKLLAESGVVQTEGEICLEFLSPIPFSRDKDKNRTFVSKETFIKTFENRLSRLSGKDIVYENGDDVFSVLPYYWNYTEIRHPSHSRPGHTQYINGCSGKLYIKGRFKNLLPFLILGSEIHAGSKLSNSQGYYILHKESPGFFDKQFPNKKAMVSVIKDVLDRYDNALESLSAMEKFPFKEDEYADELCRRIIEDRYLTTPHTAFLIKKKTGVDRLVEQPSFRDLIVHQYLYPQLNRFMDDEAFHIAKRQRKKPDRINSLLNYGYYLLFSRINATVRAIGLNPYLGFLHSPEDDYESLVCDIEELFRSRIDRLIIRMVNLKVIAKDDFTDTEKGLYLTRDALAKFLNQFEAEMERKTSTDTLSLKESIYVQTTVVKNFMLEGKPLTFYSWDV